MSQDNELRRLEQFVEKLLANFSQLRAEKAKLEQELQERDVKLENLRRSLESKDMERGEISQRVSKIVEQIEEWESTLENEFEESGQLKTGKYDDPEQHMDTSDSIAVEDDLKSEEEGRAQQKNLFS
jgi:chromosome segregation ATPase